jgi:hypothetical protein
VLLETVFLRRVAFGELKRAVEVADIVQCGHTDCKILMDNQLAC